MDGNVKIGMKMSQISQAHSPPNHNALQWNPESDTLQCLHTYSARLSTRFEMHHQSTTHSTYSLCVHISGHWPPLGQRQSLVAEGRWHNVARDVRSFVQGCSDCAISKNPRHLPSGKLFPLPVPNRPWSHPGVDFITDLSASNGNTCVLVVIDRFSKYCRLLPLKGLPTAIEMAMLMLNKILYINDILDPTLLE